MNAILAVRKLMKRSCFRQRKVYVAFIDLEKLTTGRPSENIKFYKSKRSDGEILPYSLADNDSNKKVVL